MVEIDDARTAALAGATALPADFSYAASFRDDVSGCGVLRDECNESFVLFLVPDISGLAHEEGSLRNRDERFRHGWHYTPLTP